jgi:hypothetical protein
VDFSNNQKIKFHFQRFEFKYQLPLDLVEGMVPELLKYMDWDHYAKNLPDNSYRVASLYYDSVGLGCYYDKINGQKTRKKLRIRFYDQILKPDTKVFLEIKRKYDTVVIKDRLILTHRDCKELLQENKKVNLPNDNSLKDTLDEFLWLRSYNGMVPQIMVLYERKPLVSKIDPNFRVTIDYNIRAYLADWLSDKNDGKLVNPGLAVLEVKFNNVLPFWFLRIIQRYNLQTQPFSKFSNSMEVCRPELAHRFVEMPVYLSNYL